MAGFLRVLIYSLFIALGVCTGWAEKVSGVSGEFEASVFAKGLSEPDGLAVHFESGDVYIAEKGAGRISVVTEGGAKSTVVESGGLWSIDPEWPRWMISEGRPKQAVVTNRLVQPGGVAVSSNRHIFVAEDVPYGRVLEFIPDELGAYSTAKLVSVPWFDRAFSWDDLKINKNGDLYLVGSIREAKGGLHFGSVLYRDENLNWWVIDYGPFADYSSVALTENDNVLIQLARNKGSTYWWDTFRHLTIGTFTETLDESSQGVSCGLFSDGSIAIGEVMSSGKGRVWQYDPLLGEKKVAGEGFQSIGNMIFNPKTQRLLVSDPKAGVVAEFVTDNLNKGQQLLERSHHSKNLAEGFTPREAPAFLKNFLMGMGAFNPAPITESGDDPGGAAPTSFTLREFAHKVPLIAGKLITTPLTDDEQASGFDFVTNVTFVVFYPNQTIESGESATPSLSFFVAEKSSGKREITKPMFEGLNSLIRKGDEWDDTADAAKLYVPITASAVDKTPEGLDINLAFLGLSFYDDYYLGLGTGKEDKGTMVVEGKDGSRVYYVAKFTEVAKDGSFSRNLVVAGFDPNQRQDLGWLEIGRYPISDTITPDDSPFGGMQGVSDEFKEEIKKKDRERRLEIGVTEKYDREEKIRELLKDSESKKEAPPVVGEQGASDPGKATTGESEKKADSVTPAAAP